MYTAEIGLSQARYFLMAKDCLPPNWQACVPGINDTTLTSISAGMKSVFPAAMPQFSVAGQDINLDLAGTFSRNGNDVYDYQVWARTTSAPKVLNVVVVSKKPGAASQTVVDAGVIFTKPVGSDYKQLGQGGTREGITGETLGADAATARTNF